MLHRRHKSLYRGLKILLLSPIPSMSYEKEGLDLLHYDTTCILNKLTSPLTILILEPRSLNHL